MLESKDIEKLILKKIRESQIEWNKAESMSEDRFYNKGRVDVLTELLNEAFGYHWRDVIQQIKDLL